MIDSHVHIGGDAAGFEMNEELVLKSMEKYHMDISIVSNGDSAEYCAFCGFCVSHKNIICVSQASTRRSRQARA